MQFANEQQIGLYKTNLMSDYDNKNVLYVGDIGEHNDEHLYKFGKTSNIYTRDYGQHKKTFEQFHIVHIVEYDNNVEQIFKRELLSKQLLREITINQKKQTESFTTTIEHNIASIIDLLNGLVDRYPLQAIANKDREHREILMKNEYDKDVLIEREKTKQKEIELKIKDIELKILQLGIPADKNGQLCGTCDQNDIFKQYLDDRTTQSEKHTHIDFVQ